MGDHRKFESRGFRSEFNLTKVKEKGKDTNKKDGDFELRSNNHQRDVYCLPLFFGCYGTAIDVTVVSTKPLG